MIRLAPAVLLPSIAVLFACNGPSSNIQKLPACSWSATLNSPDASAPAWATGRSFLSCLEGNSTVLCLGDADGTTCAVNPMAGSSVTNCSDLCATDEFAVVTNGTPTVLPDGGTAIPGGPALPGTCRQVTALPSGAVVNCCTCQ